jgi:hypothetical protein
VLVGLLPGSAVAQAIENGALDDLAEAFAATIAAGIDAARRARAQPPASNTPPADEPPSLG